MFLRSAARPVAVDCFFCLSPSLLPPHPVYPSDVQVGDRDKGSRRSAAAASSTTPLALVGTRWNWRCERCGCWNVRDRNGDMVSDLPAMHRSNLNEQSFSLRATPSKSHLPSATSSSKSSPFCHSCEANQVLIMNMLANYLPADDDPTFQSLYDNLPQYLASLHARYPPVCSSCQPAVDAALRKSDQKAQSEAWGLALRRGAKATASVERVAVGPGALAVLVWSARGMLFCLGAALSIAVDALAWTSNETFQQIRPFATTLAALHSCSILWIAWDPYWLRKTRRKAKVTGRSIWVRNMAIAMFTRIVVAFSLLHPSGVQVARAALALELGLLLHALVSLRISQPVPLKLVRPVSLTSTPQPNSSPARNLPTDPVGLSSLSLEHDPLRSQSSNNPIFGQPSLTQVAKEEPASEPMDWEPAPSAPARSSVSSDEDDDSVWRSRRSDWDSFGVGKQRMFPSQAGQDETGLETLLAGWGIGTNAGVVEPRGVALPSSSNGGGLFVDAQLVRSVTLVLAAARLAGAFGGIVSHIAQDHVASIGGAGLNLKLAPMLSTADTALSSLEAGTAAIDLVISLRKQDGGRIALLSGALALRAIVGALVVFGGVLGLSLGALWAEWIGSVGWVGWALVDVVCA